MRSPIFNDERKERRDGRRNADAGFGAVGGTGEWGQQNSRCAVGVAEWQTNGLADGSSRGLTPGDGQ